MTSPSTTVTIAHLSDVHLGPITGFEPRYWNAKRALGFLNWQRNRRGAFRRDTLDRLVADLQAQAPDHIAITGDLINIGLPAEMAMAAGWLATVGPPDHVAVIPGNHDIYTSMRGDRGLDRWADYLCGDDKRALVFPYVRRIGDVALIGLNSAMETKPFVAAGQLGEQQRARLADILDALGRERVFRLVMIHHPPLPGQAHPSKALRDADALAAVLARHGAELVIHGHNHRAMRASIGPGKTPVIGVPAASMSVAHAHEPLARYNLYRIARSAAETPWSIRMQSRGLRVPGGLIAPIEDVVLSHVP
jgi:3',5'-cyclic AMP phosphodiesterase CpdA